ncbi:Gfo/Idh/MocA family protein [Bacillus pumilus]|uniref:Gfo/Idh/MocA family protein n=1 Tax=Bacillus pumilus TaxID=1408 RepID=UPI0011AA1906|nr:Gfo/Idh/MocA family oxidoreductase [Bacillus pumilus]
MKKIGIVGAGNIAKAHARALSTIKGAELSGVYDLHESVAQGFIKQYGGRVYSSIETLADASDGLIIASPNFCHKDHALQALRAGQPILCEKPMAVSLKEAKEMVETAKQFQVQASMGFNYRYLSFVNILKNLIANGELGRILTVRTHFKKNSALRRKTFSWRDSSESLRTSGALGDLGIHLIDMLWYLFGSEMKKDSLNTKMLTHVKEKEEKKVQVDDHTEIFGQMENQVFFHLVTSKSTQPEECGFSVEVIGHDKVFKYHTNMKNEYEISDGLCVERHQMPQTLLTDPPNEFYGWSDTFRDQLMHWVNTDPYPSHMKVADFVDGYRAQAALNTCFEREEAVESAQAY